MCFTMLNVKITVLMIDVATNKNRNPMIGITNVAILGGCPCVRFDTMKPRILDGMPITTIIAKIVTKNQPIMGNVRIEP